MSTIPPSSPDSFTSSMVDDVVNYLIDGAFDEANDAAERLCKDPNEAHFVQLTELGAKYTIMVFNNVTFNTNDFDNEHLKQIFKINDILIKHFPKDYTPKIEKDGTHVFKTNSQIRLFKEQSERLRPKIEKLRAAICKVWIKARVVMDKKSLTSRYITKGLTSINPVSKRVFVEEKVKTLRSMR